jgi:hypothetical protein
MVSKCANPACSAPFLYLRQGKLFRIETSRLAGKEGPSFGADPTIAHSIRHLEFFWLCDDCAPRMTVAFKPGRGVMVLQQPPPRARVAMASL